MIQDPCMAANPVFSLQPINKLWPLVIPNHCICLCLQVPGRGRLAATVHAKHQPNLSLLQTLIIFFMQAEAWRKLKWMLKGLGVKTVSLCCHWDCGRGSSFQPTALVQEEQCHVCLKVFMLDCDPHTPILSLLYLTEHGGNTDGQPCVFPFVYKGRKFYTCTDEHVRPRMFWCATTNNFDKDRKWSYCADTILIKKPSHDANPERTPCDPSGKNILVLANR
uniref:Fibronectin type-II domain-containing protein n=1 Tax=Anolis carolinensis TaxID=28377 RepID=A0A803THF5_ANOCA